MAPGEANANKITVQSVLPMRRITLTVKSVSYASGNKTSSLVVLDIKRWYVNRIKSWPARTISRAITGSKINHEHEPSYPKPETRTRAWRL